MHDLVFHCLRLSNDDQENEREKYEKHVMSKNIAGDHTNMDNRPMSKEFSIR